jgi:hypothetical protein
MKSEFNNMKEFSEFNLFVTSTRTWLWFTAVPKLCVHTLTYFEKRKPIRYLFFILSWFLMMRHKYIVYFFFSLCGLLLNDTGTYSSIYYLLWALNLNFLLYRLQRKLVKIYLLASLCLSVRPFLCPHVRTREPLTEFSWNFIMRSFTRTILTNV